MKKTFYLLAALAGIIMLSACNKEIESQQEENNQNNETPWRITATIEPYADGNPSGTKTGIIEENDNYAAGEQFYWHDQDEISIYLTNSGDNTFALQGNLISTVSVPSGAAKSSKATFVPRYTNIYNETGTYDIYGMSYGPNYYRPWGDWHSRIVAFSNDMIQTDATSKHLSRNFILFARGPENVYIEKSNPPTADYNFNFIHFESVMRFSFLNSSSNTNLRLLSINVSTLSGQKYFRSYGKLVNLKTDNTLTFDETLNTSDATLSFSGPDAGVFVNKGGKLVADGYMAFLPSLPFDAPDFLVVSAVLTDGTNNYKCRKYLAFDDPAYAEFLQPGIQQGKSYYFKLRIEDNILTQFPGTVYKVGDYWPDPNVKYVYNSSSMKYEKVPGSGADAEAVVAWLDPESSGTHGVMINCKLSGFLPWANVYVDETAAGVTGLDDRTSGKVGTKNLINKYKDDPSFHTKYSGFYWLYNTINGGDPDGPWYLMSIDEVEKVRKNGDIIYLKLTRQPLRGIAASSNITWTINQYSNSHAYYSSIGQTAPIVRRIEKTAISSYKFFAVREF